MNCPACQAPVVETQPFCSRCGSALPKVAAADPLIGQVFAGRYKILKLLGEGGMGCVYLAEQNLGTSVRKVALKTLHRHLSNDDAIRERFQREVGTVAELEHPNTIQVFDFGTASDGQLFIVMEFVQGESLADALTKARFFSPERTKRVLSQVCGALSEAHQRGIVHRDLKPDNVILTKRAGQEDFVKLLDFGIAKRSAEADANEKKLTQQGMVLGTPPYMSPEQFTGRAVDARSDIYAIGVMAYEMLTGELPFKADTAWEWATQHMREAPRPIEGAPHGGNVPRPMRKAISRALAKAPEDRFTTVNDFFQAFAGEATEPGQSANPAPIEGKGGTLMGEPLGAVAAAGASPSPIGFSSGAPRPGGTEAGGTPLAPPASYVASAVPAGNGTFVPGAPYAPSPSVPAYGPAPHHVTPPAGNHAFPTPHAVPRAPVYTTSNGKEGGSRRGLLIAAGVIGLLSIAAVAIALYVESGPTPVVVTQPLPTTPTATDTGTAVVTSDPTTPTATPTLGGTTPPQPLPTSPGTTPRPTANPTTKPSTSPTPTPTPVPTPTPTQTLPFPLPTFVPTPTPTPTPVPTPVPTPSPTPNAPNMAQKCQEARARPPGPMREFEIRKYCQ